LNCVPENSITANKSSGLAGEALRGKPLMEKGCLTAEKDG
jgi:hypothetical protein